MKNLKKVLITCGVIALLLTSVVGATKVDNSVATKGGWGKPSLNSIATKGGWGNPSLNSIAI